MSDEKWWFGLVARTFAKMCPELGIEQQSFSAHHKSHINKVMGHATVAYLFHDNPENGGKGFLIGLHRCQNYKVVARTINETTIDPVTRKQKRKGNLIKHKLGDIVLVDCNVKRSDNGTPSDPKFALRTLWEAIILPAYDALTAPCGPADLGVQLLSTRRITLRLTKKVIFTPGSLMNSAREAGDWNSKHLKTLTQTC
jgi:hypothetical protein